MAENLKFEIVEHLIELSSTASGWTKELNRVSWNGAEPKYDLRAWSPDHQKMGKGITLSTEEFAKLVKELKNE
ncbi:YdbC family protein [Lactovum odontotermitis]